MARMNVSIRPGVNVEVDVDDKTGKITIVNSQDIQPILEQAKREREGRTDWRPWEGNKNLGGAVKVCSLAPVHQMMLVQMNIATFDGGFKIVDEAAFQRWLDTYMDGALKSTEGRAFNV